MPQILLSEFVTPSPSYRRTDSLELLWRDWLTGHWEQADCVVIVDEQHCPLGIIRLGKLGPVMGGGTQPILPLPDRPLSGYEWGTVADWPSLIEPVDWLAANAPLDQLRQSPHWPPQRPIALINADQAYVGLLSLSAVLAQLVPRQITPLSPNAPSPPVTTSPETTPSRREQRWLIDLSHTLKTPMTSLLGLSTLLMDERLGSLNPRQTHYVSLMRQTVRKLIKTINQLLDWMRIESHQLTLLPEPVNLSQLCNGALSTYIHQFGQHDPLSQAEQPLSWQIQDGLTTIMADPLRLKQILWYLIDSGWESGPTSCQISINRWGDWIALTVSHPHLVIPPQQQPDLVRNWSSLQIGPDYLRIDAVALGLADRLMNLHGGSLTFISSPQGGTQFTGLFPDPAITATDLPSTWLVLLICTDPVLIETINQLLAPSHFRLGVARSWIEAVEKVNRLKPALILVNGSDPALQSRPNQTWQEFYPICLRAQIPVLAILPTVNLASDQDSSPYTRVLPLSRLSQDLLTSLEQLARSRPVCHPKADLSRLTLLHLKLASDQSGAAIAPMLTIDLATWLHTYNCRIIVADDMKQADTLSRIWQPDAVLLDANLPTPALELARLAQCPYLRQYPLITLNDATTQAAQQFESLQVLPWTPIPRHDPERAVAALLRLIRPESYYLG